MDSQDRDLIMLLASSSASLAKVPGKNNWIEKADGDLPPYVRKLARGIMKSGKTMSQAIAIAISRCKMWAAGGADVNADTRAKAAKAVAQWEALKAKNAAKKVVKASREDGSEYLMLSEIGSFNTDQVRTAWYARENARARAAEEAARALRATMPHEEGLAERIEPSWVIRGYLKELWTDFIIVEYEDQNTRYEKVPYTVQGSEVVFGEPQPVKQEWQESDEELSDEEKGLLSDVLRRSGDSNFLEKVRTIATQSSR